MSIARILAVLTLATTAGAASAAIAIVPGAMCSSDGAVDLPTNGALLNAVPGASSTTKFHCPLVRQNAPNPYGSTVSVTINARVNYSGQYFECVLRSVLPNGSVHDSSLVYLPPKTANNGGLATTGVSVSLPPIQPASIHLRCNVPNVASGEAAGIISLKVDD